MENRPAPQRLERLKELAKEVRCPDLNDDSTTLSPGQQIPTYRTPNDEQQADALLAQMRHEETQSQPQQKGFTRAFSNSKKPQSPFTYKEVHAALTRVVDTNASAGVVEVLLARLRGLGHDPNLARKASTNILKRIKNVDAQDQRGRLLQTAAELGRLDFMHLLIQHADQEALDQSLSISLTKRNLPITELLLRNSANASLFQSQFLEAVQKGDPATVSLFLRSPKRPQPTRITEVLYPATVNGNIWTILLLMRAGANGDYDNAKSLLYAVENGRVDIVTAIMMATNPPSPVSLDRAIGIIFTDPTVNLVEKQKMIESLLCGGPQGNAVSEGLVKATLLGAQSMMRLLMTSRASINHRDASALK